jgi:hypothetical protein
MTGIMDGLLRVYCGGYFLVIGFVAVWLALSAIVVGYEVQ